MINERSHQVATAIELLNATGFIKGDAAPRSGVEELIINVIKTLVRPSIRDFQKRGISSYAVAHALKGGVIKAIET